MAKMAAKSVKCQSHNIFLNCFGCPQNVFLFCYRILKSIFENTKICFDDVSFQKLLELCFLIKKIYFLLGVGVLLCKKIFFFFSSGCVQILEGFKVCAKGEIFALKCSKRGELNNLVLEDTILY